MTLLKAKLLERKFKKSQNRMKRKKLSSHEILISRSRIKKKLTKDRVCSLMNLKTIPQEIIIKISRSRRTMKI